MGKYELLATSGMIINMFSFITLVKRIHDTKNTITLSWAYLISIMFAQFLFIIYSYVNGAWGILYPTLFLFVGLIYIAYVKFIYTEEVLKKMEQIKQTKQKQ